MGWGRWSSLLRVGSGDGVSLVAAGGGTRAGVCRRRLGMAGVCWDLRVVREWPGPRGGGRGGMVWGWHRWWPGGWGWVLCWKGVWASRRVLWVLRVRAVRFLRSLAGRGVWVLVGVSCLGIWMGLWSVGSGWLLVDGACWHGLQVGGLPVVVGCSM